MLLFVTEHKSSDRTQYVDHLDGDVLHWQGQESRRTDSLVIDHASTGMELLVLYRQRKDEFPSYGFRYLGPFTYVSHETPAGPGASSFVLRRAGVAALLTVPLSPQEGDDQPFSITVALYGDWRVYRW